jgi:hypothetical protein
MRLLRRFLGLKGVERLLLVKVTLLLIATRLAMLVVRYPRLARHFDRRGQPTRRQDGLGAAEISWAVNAVGRRLGPLTTCLGMALVARLLLTRRSIPSRLHFGVARDEVRNFTAHAWLECDGRVIVGRSEARNFTPLSRPNRPPGILS